jgi:hypothetical protein
LGSRGRPLEQISIPGPPSQGDPGEAQPLDLIPTDVEHAVEHDADFGALAAMLESVGGDETSDGADELPEGDPPRSIRAGTLCTSERLHILRG